MHLDFKFDFESLDRHFYTTSSCGVCGKTAIDLAVSNCSFVLKKNLPKVSIETILKLPAELRKHQNLFDKTGGNHACGLFDSKGLLLHYAEDVGRHNAMDKLIGKVLKDKMIPCDNHIVLVSGRASFELIQKTLMIGIPIFVAIGAPSSLAVELAENFGLSLIGFLRENKGNVYAGAGRIISS